MIASNVSVGLVAFLLDMYARCVLPFSHILDLMVFSLFLIKEIILSTAPFLSSFFILLTMIGLKTTQSWSCHIYLRAAGILLSPNFLVPSFKLYVCINLKDFKLSIPDRAVFVCVIVIAIICAYSELYSSVYSPLACKCFHLCGGNLTLSVRLMH